MTGDSPLAIVGLSYRAPGVGRKGLWDFLCEAKSAWSPTPEQRFDHDAYYHPDHSKAGCISAKGGHFLPDDIYAFDAPFFKMTADEALNVDPHQRLLLECAFEAAENAGIDLATLAGSSTGVYAAAGSLDHIHQSSEDMSFGNRHSAVGMSLSLLANRVSHFFDLLGPSITMDSACASSMYAVHTACQAIRAGECDVAFVGATSLLLGPDFWSALDTMGTLSAEGKSFSYDQKASGFGRGEGGSCLIIKSLSDAIEAGDPIHAVVRSTAANHGGRTGTISSPSRVAQESLLLQVHRQTGLNPRDTAVVEGHGTGTRIGDPIEASAFSTVLAEDRSRDEPLYLSSIKSNFGHTESASGLLGIVKAVLQLQHQLVLPSAHFEKMNTSIEGQERLQIPTKVSPWPSTAAKRIIVTNFGFGGSNAAIILDQANDFLAHWVKQTEPPTCHADRPAQLRRVSFRMDQNERTDVAVPRQNGSDSDTSSFEMVDANAAGSRKASPGGSNNLNDFRHNASEARTTSQKRLFVFSAKSESSLRSYLASFAAYLESVPRSPSLVDDLCFTLGQRRTHFAHRAAVPANSVDSLREELSARMATFKSQKANDPIVAFIFTGQGAQYARMAIELEIFEPFAVTLKDAELRLHELGADWSLREELAKAEEVSQINEARISQPCCTAVQLALISLFKSWNIMPKVVTGHSSGEIAAAFAAGLISFDAAIAIAFFRGEAVDLLLEDETAQGAMLALGTSAEQAEELLSALDDQYATVAAVNSPESVTVSGDTSAIEVIEQAAKTKGLFARRLKVNVAYHSQYMERVAGSYLASILPFCTAVDEASEPNPAAPTFISSVTGKQEGARTVDASYWVKNLVQPVKFLNAVKTMLMPNLEEDKETTSRPIPNVIVEVGPHSALKGPLSQIMAWTRLQKIDSVPVYVPSLVRGSDAQGALLESARVLFMQGCNVSFRGINCLAGTETRVLSDLPSYEWNKSHRFEPKSRVAYKRRFPGMPYKPFLGWKSPYHEGPGHSFRQAISLEHMPWIREHRVDGDPMMPFTGYIALATEAVRSLDSVSPQHIAAREVHVKRSLRIHEDEQADVTVRLKPIPLGTEIDSTNVWSFEILSWTEEKDWTTHCSGQIEASSNELSPDSTLLQQAEKLMANMELEGESAENEYSALEQAGVKFGPSFRRMSRLRVTTDGAVHDVEMRDLDLIPSDPESSPVTTDPPALDSFLHASGAFPGLNPKKHGGYPTYVRRLHLSNRIPYRVGQRFTIATCIEDMSPKIGSWIVNVVVFAQTGSSLLPVAIFQGFQLRSFVPPGTIDNAINPPKGFCYKVTPCVDLLNRLELERLVQIEDYPEAEVQESHKLNEAGLYFMLQALKSVPEHQRHSLPSHYSSFLKWSQRTFESMASKRKARELELINTAPTLVPEVRNSNGSGAMLCAVGEHIGDILRGKVQPLEVMLQDDMLVRSYEQNHPAARGAKIMAKYVRLLSKTNPKLRILEIGAGTASATTTVLEAVSDDGELRVAEYMFTDISAGFFDNARSRLKKWANVVRYQRLDISQDPVPQGFAPETYDLIIAGNVLHATPDMAETLRNTRSMLKPGGHLLLLEAVVAEPSTMSVALLPGWWLSQDKYRGPDGPLLASQVWDRMLSENGFSGLDLCVPDYPGNSYQLMNVFCTTKVPNIKPEMENTKVTVLTSMESLEQSTTDPALNKILDAIKADFAPEATLKSILDCDSDENPLCIFIDGPRHSIWKDLDETGFHAVKQLLLKTAGLLWVTVDTCEVHSQTIKGFLRTFRLEDTSKNMLHVDQLPSEQASAVVQLAKHLRSLMRSQSTTGDQEFVWRDGMIQVPRLTSLKSADDAFNLDAGLPVRRLQQIAEHSNPLRLTSDCVGTLESIYFGTSNVLKQDLKGDEIIIQNEKTGLVFRDLLQVLGQIPWKTEDDGPGHEGVGVVHRVGSNVTHVEVGDRVFYSAIGGALGTHLRIQSCFAQRLPDGLNDADAVGLSVAYSTAIVVVQRTARLQKNESILIHSASGATGQACVRLAQHIGAEVFVTAGTPEKRSFLRDTFQIPETHIFSSRNSEFANGIKRIVAGRGLDVVVNSLSGRLLRETWELIADFGRWCEIGRKDFVENNYLEMRPLLRNVSFHGIDLNAIHIQRPHIIGDLLAEIVDLFGKGVATPIQPVTEIPISELAGALRKLQTGQSVGKLVLTWDPKDIVFADVPKPALPPHGLFKSDATYLITGGTGGVGRFISSWMIENGARHVVLLGRSGSKNPGVAKLVESYQRNDINLRAIACDVGRKEDLLNAVSLMQDMPPVRGVIHGALFLRDALLNNATFKDWQDISTPRIQGAMNIHDCLPELDFFVLLSSVVSHLGLVGQTIYGGTGTFYDAFAKKLLAEGQHAVSVSVAIVEDVGYIKDRDMNDSVARTAGISINGAELTTLIRGAVLGTKSGLHRDGLALAGRRLGPASSLPWSASKRLAALLPSQDDVYSQSDGRTATQPDADTSTDAGSPESFIKALISKVSSMTMIDLEDISLQKPLGEYGLDSLVSVELRNWIRRETGVELALSRILESKNLQDLSEHVSWQRQDNK